MPSLVLPHAENWITGKTTTESGFPGSEAGTFRNSHPRTAYNGSGANSCGFRLSAKRINPDEWEAHSGFISIDGEVAYSARHGSTATEALAKLWLALHAV